MNVDAAEPGSKAAQLQQAVALLGAETDEKRFVGLLLVTKVAVAPAELRMVFESGYAFVRRLLSSPPPPEDSQTGAAGNAYRALALSVLASFCTDPELGARTELLECLSAAAAALSDTVCVASPAEARDAQTVLCTVLQQPGGLAEAAGARICSRLLAPAAARSASPGPPLAGEQEEEDGPGCACTVLALLGNLALATASGPATASDGGRAVARALSADLLHAAASLSAAAPACRDRLAFRRLAALAAVLAGAAATADCHPAESESEAFFSSAQPARSGSGSVDGGSGGGGSDGGPGAPPELAPSLRAALGTLLASKLSAAARADALHAVVCALQLLGPCWLVGPSPLAMQGGDAAGDGALLSLVVQLAGVELAMCLYDQPGEIVGEHAARLLPVCCGLLEEALFRLHDTGGPEEEDEEGEEGVAGMSGEAWLDALSDAQLLTAQRAFVAAVGNCLDFIEAMRAEASRAAAAPAAPAAPAAAPGDDGDEPRIEELDELEEEEAEVGGSQVSASHALLLPVARLLAAWLVQPSAPCDMLPYDRACSLLPFLRAETAAAAAAGAPWAQQLHAFERDAPHAAPAAPRSGEAPTDETMAALFERVMPRNVDADTMADMMAQQRASNRRMSNG